MKSRLNDVRGTDRQVALSKSSPYHFYLGAPLGIEGKAVVVELATDQIERMQQTWASTRRRASGLSRTCSGRS